MLPTFATCDVYRMHGTRDTGGGSYCYILLSCSCIAPSPPLFQRAFILLLMFCSLKYGVKQVGFKWGLLNLNPGNINGAIGLKFSKWGWPAIANGKCGSSPTPCIPKTPMKTLETRVDLVELVVWGWPMDHCGLASPSLTLWPPELGDTWQLKRKERFDELARSSIIKRFQIVSIIVIFVSVENASFSETASG